jgi:hypothetical protein
MTAIAKNVPALATIAALSLGLAIAGAMGANQATAASTGDTRCQIQASANNSMTTIEGVINSPTALSGSYQFEVVASGPGGSSNINQGGAFQAPAGSPVTIGKVMLGNPGATYDVKLVISSNDGAFNCADRIASQ